MESNINPNIEETIKALSSASQGFGHFINIISDKITPEMTASLDPITRSKLEGQLKELQSKSNELKDLPDMLHKVSDALKNHNL